VPEPGLRELLESGVHFGHQTRRWNPKMRRFIHGERGGIYLIDVLQTQELLHQARLFAHEIADRGGIVLFVGTKKQARDAIAQTASSAGMPYVNHRWLGGLLTNWNTMSRRISRLHDLERYSTEGQLELLPTKERMTLQADLAKLQANLGGVKDMPRVPDAMFVIDLKTEEIAVREAQRLRIPIIGLVDTNCDPDGVAYVVPGNDDAIRSCALITQAIGEVVQEGHQRWAAAEEKARLEAEERARREAEERARREAEEQARREAAEQAAAEAAAAAQAAGEQPAGAGAPAAETAAPAPRRPPRRPIAEPDPPPAPPSPPATPAAAEAPTPAAPQPPSEQTEPEAAPAPDGAPAPAPAPDGAPAPAPEAPGSPTPEAEPVAAGEPADESCGGGGGPLQAARDLAGGVVGAAQDVTGGVVEAAQDVTGGVVEAAQDVAGGVVEAAQDVTAGARKAVADVAGGGGEESPSEEAPAAGEEEGS
jgi:small subunit ribosomal protein S2